MSQFMKKPVLFLLTITFLASCATTKKAPIARYTPKIKKVAPKPQLEPIADYRTVSIGFLKSCELDLEKSSALIADKNLIKTLSHLNKMGSGGKHYYLLEKDNITMMLTSLSSYTYSDSYLIDNKGRFVYAMYNEEVLGKKITSYNDRPFKQMFFSGLKGESLISDVTTFPALSRSYDLYFSNPVIKDGEIHGVIITAVHIDNLGKQLPEDSLIINSSGHYSYHTENKMIYQADDVYNSEVKTGEEDNIALNKRVNYQNGTYVYQKMKYKTLNWTIAIKETFSTALYTE